MLVVVIWPEVVEVTDPIVVGLVVSDEVGGVTVVVETDAIAVDDGPADSDEHADIANATPRPMETTVRLRR